MYENNIETFIKQLCGGHGAHGGPWAHGSHGGGPNPRPQGLTPAPRTPAT